MISEDLAVAHFSPFTFLFLFPGVLTRGVFSLSLHSPRPGKGSCTSWTPLVRVQTNSLPRVPRGTSTGTPYLGSLGLPSYPFTQVFYDIPTLIPKDSPCAKYNSLVPSRIQKGNTRPAPRFNRRNTRSHPVLVLREVLRICISFATVDSSPFFFSFSV